MSLKTDYKDAIPASAQRKYKMVDNGDGTVSFQDFTDYTQVGDKAQASVFNGIGTEVNTHKADTVSHTTQTDKNTLAAAVQSATLGGAAVTKSGTTLQFPAYPTSLPANGGNANYANSSGNSDTVDGLHAAAFLQTANSAPVKIQSTAPSDGTALWAW